MTRAEVLPFAEAHVAEAGRCLAAYQRRVWSGVPSLSSLQDPAEAAATVQALREQMAATGTVALRDGRMEGYLLGAVQMPPPATVASLFAPARSVDVPSVGYVVAEGLEAGEVPGRLYGAAAGAWIASGCFAHSVTVMASDAGALAAWQNLGFGHLLGFGIREVAADPLVDAASNGVRFRRATSDDGPIVVELILEQLRALASGPVFNPYLPECRSDLEQSVAGLLADPTGAAWIAEQKGKAVSLQTWFAYPSGLAVPENTAYLQYCVTSAPARDTGIASALFARALGWAKDTGYHHVASSWLTANASMGSFLARQGFQPLLYKLVRRVDERVSWAHGRTGP